MKQMMVVETRDPLATPDAESTADLLARLRGEGVGCSILLAENGVLGARASAAAKFLPRLAERGVTVLADRFALAERGISERELAPSVKPAGLGVVIDHLASGAAVVWR